MITPDTISNILSAARIEEVVGDFVSLKRRGTNYLGLCPFHNEKTPSFTVSPAKGIFKCFGCGKAGNTVNFLMEYEHYTYPEALKFLAKRYHIEIEEEVQTPEKIQEQNEKETLFLINQFAQKYFEQTLFETEDGKAIGLTYLQERGFRDETIRKFQLGYSKEGWEDFSSHAVSEGYKPEYLVKTGLSIKKDESRLIDRFHGRVMFPIHSASGRIIGFGGRILTSDKQTAKYLNSPESEIYNKSKSLYGLYFARNSMVGKNNCYLVEGYTDVISLHQAGIENVVASSGTSLTHEQVKLIQRYTQNITILYDGDPAGIKASLRGIDMILEQGMNVRIVLFPDKEDPDSYARTHRAAEVEEFIGKNAVNFILFKTRLLLNETEGDPIKKAELVKEIVNTIAIIPDGITRTFFTRECSSLLAVPEQTLVNEINKLLRKKFSKKLQEEGQQPIPETEEPSVPQIEFDLESSESQEKEIIRLLLQFGNETITLKEEKQENEPDEETQLNVAELIIQDLVRDEIKFEMPVCQSIFQEMADLQQKGVFPEKDYFLNHPDPIISSLAIDLIILPYELSHHWESNQIYVQPEIERLKDSIYSALHAFKAKKIEKMISDNQKKLKDLKPGNADIEEITNCLTQQKKLEEIRRRIQSQVLGRTIIK